MGKATDMTGLQFRMLNTKKGPAVWSPRAQCDKKAYQFRLKWICESEPNLTLNKGNLQKFFTRWRGFWRRNNFGSSIYRPKYCHHDWNFSARPDACRIKSTIRWTRWRRCGNEPLILAQELIGLELGRLKTGTPPRLLRRSIDFSKTEIQQGDEPIPYFTYWKDDLFHMEQNRGRFAEQANQTGNIRTALCWTKLTDNYPAISPTQLGKRLI